MIFIQSMCKRAFGMVIDIDVYTYFIGFYFYLCA